MDVIGCAGSLELLEDFSRTVADAERAARARAPRPSPEREDAMRRKLLARLQELESPLDGFYWALSSCLPGDAERTVRHLVRATAEAEYLGSVRFADPHAVRRAGVFAAAFEEGFDFPYAYWEALSERCAYSIARRRLNHMEEIVNLPWHCGFLGSPLTCMLMEVDDGETMDAKEALFWMAARIPLSGDWTLPGASYLLNVPELPDRASKAQCEHFAVGYWQWHVYAAACDALRNLRPLADGRLPSIIGRAAILRTLRDAAFFCEFRRLSRLEDDLPKLAADLRDRVLVRRQEFAEALACGQDSIRRTVLLLVDCGATRKDAQERAALIANSNVEGTAPNYLFELPPS